MRVSKKSSADVEKLFIGYSAVTSYMAFLKCIIQHLNRIISSMSLESK